MNFKAFTTFLAQYYEKVLAMVVLLLLVVFSAWLAFRVNDIRAQIKEQDEKRPTGKKVAEADLKHLEEIQKKLDAAPIWKNENNWAPEVAHRVFIAPWMKQMDPKSSFPVLWTKNIDKELSREGIPNEWLLKYGFSTSQPVAEFDADGDGFSNKEEYDAKTDPKDPKSKPDYAIKLRVAQIIQKPFPYMFMSVLTGETTKYNLRSREGRDDIVKMGEMIPNKMHPGYKLISYTEKFEDKEDRTIKDSATGKFRISKVDISELTVQKEGENPFVLVKGRQAVGALACKFYFIIESRYFEVLEKSIFSLQNIQYQVISIKKLDSGGAEVLIKRMDTGVEFPAVPALNQEDLKVTPNMNMQMMDRPPMERP